MPITSAGLPARRHIPMRIGCCLFDSFAVALNRDRSRFHPFAVAYPVAYPSDLDIRGRRNTTTPPVGRPGAQQPDGRVGPRSGVGHLFGLQASLGGHMSQAGLNGSETRSRPEWWDPRGMMRCGR